MNNRIIFSRFCPLLLIVCLTWAAVGCRVEEPLPVPPAPAASNLAPLVSSPSALPSLTSQADNQSLSGAAPVSPGPLRVDVNSATLLFPDNITFTLKGYSPRVIRTVFLVYGTDIHSLSDQTTRTRVDFQESSDLSVSWPWEMKKSGSLPPGVNIWWQWELTDADGLIITLPRDSIKYTDTRYAWQVKKMIDMDLYWYRDEDTMYQLANEVQTHLDRLHLGVAIPPERKPEVYVYFTSEELRKAVLSTPGWTGALAFPGYNIILTAVNSSNPDWAKDALPHEIAHLMVGEATFGPFGDLPLWLNEGLAEYTRGPMSAEELTALKDFTESEDLLSLASLNTVFPADAAKAGMAYVESRSFVSYLIDTYGWEKLRRLLELFKEGSTVDMGLRAVYSLDLNSLEIKWLDFLEASQD